MWVEFVVGSLPCFERFFSGYSGFPLSSKTNISKFQFDQESDRWRTTIWMYYLQIVIYLFYLICFRVNPRTLKDLTSCRCDTNAAPSPKVFLRSCVFVRQGIEPAAAAPTSGTRQTELTIKRLVQTIASENSRHFTTPTLVSPRNDAWWTSKEIPYWWRVTTQIWVMLVIGWSKFPTRLYQSEPLPRSGKWYVISMELLRSFLNVISRGNQWQRREMSAVFWGFSIYSAIL